MNDATLHSTSVHVSSQPMKTMFSQETGHLPNFLYPITDQKKCEKMTGASSQYRPEKSGHD